MGICRNLCHSLNFVNIQFIKVIFFPMEFYEKIYLHGKFVTEFYFILLTLSHMFPWMNKLLFTENIFLPCLIN